MASEYDHFAVNIAALCWLCAWRGHLHSQELPNRLCKMVQVAAWRPHLYQQDGVQAYTSHQEQNLLSVNLQMFWSKRFWPHSSLGLNPLDYYLWGILEKDANEHAHNSVESLKVAIKEALTKMHRQHSVNACNRFRARVQAVTEKGERMDKIIIAFRRLAVSYCKRKICYAFFVLTYD